MIQKNYFTSCALLHIAQMEQSDTHPCDRKEVAGHLLQSGILSKNKIQLKGREKFILQHHEEKEILQLKRSTQRR